jgi:UDP-N-acetylmuramoylalanine--D-glutamate ligase
VGAVMRALETFSRPVILLMGGRDKEGDFENLATPVSQRVKRLVLFGEARAKIDGLIGGLVKTDQAATLGDAMELARHHASAGDVVLCPPVAPVLMSLQIIRREAIFSRNGSGIFHDRADL